MLPEYSENFIPPVVTFQLPKCMSMAFKSDFVGKDLYFLIDVAKNMFHLYDITMDQSNVIEDKTKKQRSNKL